MLSLTSNLQTYLLDRNPNQVIAPFLSRLMMITGCTVRSVIIIIILIYLTNLNTFLKTVKQGFCSGERRLISDVYHFFDRIYICITF